MRKFLLFLFIVITAQTAWGVEKQLRTVCLGGVQYYVFSEWRNAPGVGYGYGYMAPVFDPLTKEVKTCLKKDFECAYNDRFATIKHCKNTEE